MTRRRTTLIPSFFVVLAAACSSGSPPVTEATTKEAMSAEARFVEARRPSTAALLEAPAHVVSLEPGTAEISVLHEARVLRFRAAPGDAIEAGQPLADLVIPAVSEAAARLGPLAARRSALRRRLEELEKLRSEGLARAAALFELRIEASALEADYRAALALLKGYGIEGREVTSVRDAGHVALRSPASGVVIERNGRAGAVVGPGSPPLLVIGAERPARIEASFVDAPPKGARLAFFGQDGREVRLAPEPVARFRDGRTGRLTAWLEPEPEMALPDGLTGRVRLQVASGAVEVPSDAVGRDEDGAYVRKLDREGVRRTEVEVLLDSGTTSVVRGADLKIGDRVQQSEGGR